LAYGDHGKQKWIEAYGSYPFSGVRNTNLEDVIKVEEFMKLNDIPLK
jgi:hypothetical protein